MSDNLERTGKYIVLSMQYSFASKKLIEEHQNDDFEMKFRVRPALYLLRHSLELMLKALHFMNGHKMWGHDLINLNIDISSIFKNVSLPSDLIRIIDEHLPISEVSPKEYFKFINEVMTKKIEFLAAKYNNHSYLKEFSFSDSKNELLRYPDNEEFEKVINNQIQISFTEIINDCDLVFSYSSFIILGFGENRS